MHAMHQPMLNSTNLTTLYSTSDTDLHPPLQVEKFFVSTPSTFLTSFASSLVPFFTSWMMCPLASLDFRFQPVWKSFPSSNRGNMCASVLMTI